MISWHKSKQPPVEDSFPCLAFCLLKYWKAYCNEIGKETSPCKSCAWSHVCRVECQLTPTEVPALSVQSNPEQCTSMWHHWAGQSHHEAAGLESNRSNASAERSDQRACTCHRNLKYFSQSLVELQTWKMSSNEQITTNTTISKCWKLRQRA